MSPSQVLTGGHLRLTSSATPPPPFAPDDIAGLIGAWDFSDTASITEAGGAVSQVDGAYGTSLALTQGTGSAQPTTGTRTQNGLNVLDFDGSGDYMTASGTFDMGTVFVVTRCDEATFGNYDGLVTGANPNVALLGVQGSATFDQNFWAQPVDRTVYVDGVATTNAPMQTTGIASVTSTGGIATGGTIYVGCDRGDTGRSWDGFLCEILVYDSVLSGANLALVEAFLNAKWGVY